MALKNYISLILISVFSNTFYCQLQIPNSDFETGIDSSATGWMMDFIGAGRNNQYFNSGNNSMSVWNWYYYAEGFTFNGNSTHSSATSNIAKYGGTPIGYKPAILTGYYHYDTSGTFSDNDSAVVQVLLKKYDSINQNIDTIGYGETHLPATDLSQSFVEFNVTIHDLAIGVNPDSIIVILKSSIDGFCDVSGTGNCLYFYVDDLLLAYPLGNKVPFDFKSKEKFWPNPDSILSLFLK